jgi:hypothetical protein
MSTAWPWLACWRTWLGRWSPRKRRALAKRRLASICLSFGVSRSRAQAIASEFLR